MNKIGSAGRCLEFIPIVLDVVIEKDYVYFNNKTLRCNINHFINNIARFSYLEGNKLFTNLRCLLNAGIPYNLIPYNDDLIIKLSWYMDNDNIKRYYLPLTDTKELLVDDDVIIGMVLLNELSIDYKNELVQVKVSNLIKNNICTLDNIIYGIKNSKVIIKDMNNFKAIKARIPMYIFGQLKTHTRITSVSQSDRVAVQLDYWLPMDFEKRLRSHKKKVEEVKSILDDTLDNEPIETLFDQINHLDEVGEELEVTELEKHNMFIEIFTTMMSQEQVQLAFKTLGYKQEIWSRAPYYFKYKEVVMTGWYNDPLVWKHLFLERNTCPDEWKNWTQKETTEFVKAIKDIITAE